MSDTTQTNGDALAAIIKPVEYVNIVDELRYCRDVSSPTALHEVYSRRRARLSEVFDAVTKSYRHGWCLKLDANYTISSLHVILQRPNTRYRAVRFNVTGNVATLDAGRGLLFTGTLDYTAKQLDTIIGELNEWLSEVKQ